MKLLPVYFQEFYRFRSYVQVLILFGLMSVYTVRVQHHSFSCEYTIFQVPFVRQIFSIVWPNVVNVTFANLLVFSKKKHLVSLIFFLLFLCSIYFCSNVYQFLPLFGFCLFFFFWFLKVQSQVVDLIFSLFQCRNFYFNCQYYFCCTP